MNLRTRFAEAALKLARNPWWGIAAIVFAIASISILTQTATTSSPDSQPEEASDTRSTEPDAFGQLDIDRMAEGMMRLDIALEPTFTSTPRPTRTAEPVLVAAPAAAAAPSEPEACAASMSGRGLALFNAMNSARANAGLPALTSDPCITYVARSQAASMASAGVLSHQTGGDAFSILRSYGVGFGWAGENIARNSYRGRQAVSVTIQGFMNSAGHRENILNPNFSGAGVGEAADARGVIYFSVVFVG